MAHRGTFPPAARLCLWQTGISSRYLGLSCSYSRAFALLGFETCLLRSRIEKGAQCCVTWWRAQGGSGLSMGQRDTSIRLESSFERRVGGKKIGNKTKGGDKMLLQCAEEMHKKESEEGKESLGLERRISTVYHGVLTMWTLLRKGNERKVLDIPSGVEVPEGSHAGKNAVW